MKKTILNTGLAGILALTTLTGCNQEELVLNEEYVQCVKPYLTSDKKINNGIDEIGIQRAIEIKKVRNNPNSPFFSRTKDGGLGKVLDDFGGANQGYITAQQTVEILNDHKTLMELLQLKNDNLNNAVQKCDNLYNHKGLEGDEQRNQIKKELSVAKKSYKQIGNNGYFVINFLDSKRFKKSTGFDLKKDFPFKKQEYLIK